MTKSERTAWSIAKQFAAAVARLETFTDDPDMVLDEIKFEARRAGSPKSRANLLAIHKALSQCTEVPLVEEYDVDAEEGL